MVPAGRMMFVIAQMLTISASSAVSNTRFVSCESSPLGPTNSTPFSGLGQLLGHTLLVNGRHGRHLLYWICCHVVDRVSHGLTPLGFQTSQFHR